MAREKVNRDPFIRIIRESAPSQADRLDEMIRRLDPAFFIDREENRILFAASRNPNQVVLGVKCSCRLQVHAYVTGIFITALGTPGYFNMPENARAALYEPVGPLLHWAVARDLQQWMGEMEGFTRDLDAFFRGAGVEMPKDLRITEDQRLFGESFFRIATAFILLHELAHLELGHDGCQGAQSILQEKDADRFAADWLLAGPTLSQPRKLALAWGISTALLWLTVSNVFLGPRPAMSHPNPYDRLFQVVERMTDDMMQDESLMTWELIYRLLLTHMHAANFDADIDSMPDDPKERVTYLINIIAAGPRSS